MEIPVLSDRELEEVLARAREEGWAELALVAMGWAPHVGMGMVVRENWPAERVFLVERLSADRVQEVASLRNLISLEMGGTGIGAEGARALGSLTGLTSLHLWSNEIGDEGARALGSLTGLTSLHLWSNEIGVEGARALGSLTSLTSLDLDTNAIGDEGVRALRPLTSLTSLRLGGNGIGAEGAQTLGPRTSLTFLNLTNNGIGIKGAQALSTLPNLISLYLGGNKIADEGARALGKLMSLTFLHLHGNKIGAEGARALGKLTSLTSLDLSDNEIGDEGARALAEAELTSLTSLKLWRNGIGDEGARALGKLTSLTSLNLWDNGIGDEGARALGKLTRLTSLNLWDNGIGDEGARALSQLTSLTSLNLENNKITDLHILRSIPSLRALYASRNPISGTPRELLGSVGYNCLPAVTAYWHDLDKGATPNDIVKILLVGNGCVGKTTLTYSLAHGYAPAEPINERTHGIVHQHIDLVLSDGSLVEARIWDFGGQELYHATHRLFFHGNAIYMLLWAEETDESPEETRHPVGYWLDMIQHLAAGSPVLLVKNQVDRSNRYGRPPDLEGRELGEVTHVEISAAKYRNIDALKASLTELVQNARHRWRYLIPKSWQAVRDTLEAWREPRADAAEEPIRVVTLGRFEQLCREHDVEDSTVLLGFLHDTGEVFHRAGHFDGSIVLDQNWFINAIYRLFDRKNGIYGLAREHGGVLSGAESQLYWHGESEENRETYFDFMLRTGMAFELNRNYRKPFAERKIVVPALLPAADAPSLRPVLRGWQSITADEVWLRLEYPFLHRGLIERIIVELSGLSEAHCWWRDGLVVEDPQTDCDILLHAATNERHLDVRLRGNRQAEALTHVRASLNEVLRQPLTRTLASHDGKTFVDLDAVDKARREGQDHVPTTTGGVVSRAAYDRFARLVQPEQDLVPEKPTDPKPIKIFISYAHADEPYREQLETRLKALGRVVPIDFWHDRKILAGAKWADDIYKQLDVADIVLLLISDNFMASDYCFSLETAKALEKYEAERGIPIPIIIRPTPTWFRHQIGQHQALPKDGKAISKWDDPDDAWENVSEGLLRALEQLGKQRGLIP